VGYFCIYGCGGGGYVCDAEVVRGGVLWSPTLSAERSGKDGARGFCGMGGHLDFRFVAFVVSHPLRRKKRRKVCPAFIGGSLLGTRRGVIE
jgi:hypothetical protein